MYDGGDDIVICLHITKVSNCFVIATTPLEHYNMIVEVEGNLNAKQHIKTLLKKYPRLVEDKDGERFCARVENIRRHRLRLPPYN